MTRSANIFVNYRRQDSSGHAGRLLDSLKNHFPGRVFMDIDTLEPGVDFAEVIESAVGSCEVLIVVIGRDWLSLKDTNGRRRLEDPQDFVRMEVAAALDRNIRVIPVLVENASMPKPEELPPELARLARRNAIELSDARWAFDVDRLIQTIERVLGEKTPPAPVPAPLLSSPPPPAGKSRSHLWIALSALVLLILAGGIGWSFVKPSAPQDTGTVASTDSVAPSPAPVQEPAPEPAPPVPEPGPVVTVPEEPPTPEPQPEPTQPDYGPDTCKNGFVWREARSGDHVCVTPEVREQTAEENRQAAARRDPAGGPYGPDTCLSGYVWREAFEGDLVCVPPESRDQAHFDNSQADERRMKTGVRLFKKLQGK